MDEGGYGDGDEYENEDRCRSSKIRVAVVMGCPFASSPNKSLLEVRF
jgi:hypothetical protein